MMIQFLHHLWSVTLELAPWLLMGAALSGIIHVVLPHDFVRRHLTGRGSILKAVVLVFPSRCAPAASFRRGSVSRRTVHPTVPPSAS